MKVKKIRFNWNIFCVHKRLQSSLFHLFTEFRNRMEAEYPVMTEVYYAIARKYLSLVPEKYKDRILNVGNGTEQPTKDSNKTAEK